MKRTVLITGASTGLGAAAALDFAKDSFVLIHYNSSEAAARSVLAQIEKNGGSGALFQADVGTEAECARLVKEVKAKVDHLDVLINNAGGMLERRSFADGLDWNLMDRTFRINTFSAMYLTSQFVPWLRKGTNPCVINITSVAIRHGAATATIYGACKSALDSFTRGAAKELAPDIRVNAVAPGVIETPFHERYSTPERMVAFKEATPLKRNGRAEHIASALRFLADNDFITGETVDVNGGIYMR